MTPACRKGNGLEHIRNRIHELILASDSETVNRLAAGFARMGVEALSSVVMNETTTYQRTILQFGLLVCVSRIAPKTLRSGAMAGASSALLDSVASYLKGQSSG